MDVPGLLCLEQKTIKSSNEKRRDKGSRGDGGDDDKDVLC